MLPIAADHPAFPGHFPGKPILPGVVLLDAVLHAVRGAPAGSAAAGGAAVWQILTAKFHNVVRPADVLTLEHETQPNGTVHFRVLHTDKLVASGTLKPEDTSPDAAPERRDG